MLLNVTNFSAASAAQVWQLTSANTISRLVDLNYSGGAFKMLGAAPLAGLGVLLRDHLDAGPLAQLDRRVG